MTAEPPQDLQDHALFDFTAISMTPSGGVDLDDSLWTSLTSDFELDSLHAGTMALDTTLPKKRTIMRSCLSACPPGSLTLLLDDEWRDHDRTQEVRPLQMHSIAMALSSAEALLGQMIQLTDVALSHHSDHTHIKSSVSSTTADHDGDADNDDGEVNIIKNEFEPLQALTRALVDKQEAVVEIISALRDMFCY
ncbi:hypothetical protein V8F33_012379 [Rhypophila sp. PSN 637]